MSKARQLSALTFNTLDAAVSAPNATAVTVATLPNLDFATYMVTAGLKAGDPTNYHAVAIVSTQGSSAKITSLGHRQLANFVAERHERAGHAKQWTNSADLCIYLPYQRAVRPPAERIMSDGTRRNRPREIWRAVGARAEHV